MTREEYLRAQGIDVAEFDECQKAASEEFEREMQPCYRPGTRMPRWTLGAMFHEWRAWWRYRKAMEAK